MGLRVHGRRLERRADGLIDKRVGIIGTGATAVQVVPHVAASAGELFVFQRTPSSIDVRANRPTDASWAASLGPGWQRERMENFTLLTSGGFAEQDLVMDGWTDIIGKLVNRLRDRSAGTGQDLAMPSSSWPTSRRWSRSVPGWTQS